MVDGRWNIYNLPIQGMVLPLSGTLGLDPTDISGRNEVILNLMYRNKLAYCRLKCIVMCAQVTILFGRVP